MPLAMKSSPAVSIGGYANGQTAHNDCENGEPFAYESGFAVQRMIVQQIIQAAGLPGPIDTNSGKLSYADAPWTDWGPYLWPSGETRRSHGLNWCHGQGDNL